MTEREYRERLREYGYGSFVAKMGAEAIQDLLKQVDLEKEITELKEEVEDSYWTKTCQRPSVVWTFWMPFTSLEISLNGWFSTSFRSFHQTFVQWLQLDGGRFASSDLNDLYRRVINRNNRLARLLELNAPGIIVQNENVCSKKRLML